MKYVRASQRPISRYETYEFAIRVRLDNTPDEEENDEAGAIPGEQADA